ncbi:hypothetical protein O181_062002 [Austropuccinia psidii MF-1]|uniref:Uncharacterized protein n=1 Tax=Austropuccinia psidii MF-1 TaxID=1389203 RepID=A0A9Q3ERH3_9BASI|nr:hypothetical protein [Austropuccinia psidii MF-1]
MPSTRSGASYKTSRSSQKGHRSHYGRSQSDTEGQASVDDSQSNKLVHSEADNTFLPSNSTDTATRRLSGYIKSQPEGLQQYIAVQRVPNPCRSVENCMNSYLTVRKFLCHPKTCKLLNRGNPLMEKENMIILKAEWRKTTLHHPSKCQKQPQ